MKGFSGLNVNLKPSWEPIIVARKPIAESTVAKQVLKTGTGAINIDGCRVSMTDRAAYEAKMQSFSNITGLDRSGVKNVRAQVSPKLSPEEYIANSAAGRWPSNVVLIHSENCRRVGSKKVDAPVINRFTDGAKPFGGGAGHEYESQQTGDAEGKEEIAVYECQNGCPIKTLDDQSGVLKTSGGQLNRSSIGFQGGSEGNQDYVPPSEGGASRFFPQFEQLEAPFMYCGKVAKKERNAGLGQQLFELREDLSNEQLEHVMLELAVAGIVL